MTIKEGSQIVAGSPEDLDLHLAVIWRIEPGADIPLTAYIPYDNLLDAGKHHIPELVVQFSGFQGSGVYLY
jgi:hypothetical protein